MRLLYHHWLSPFARKVRIALLEKRLDVQERLEPPGTSPDPKFVALNPSGEVPVMVEVDGRAYSDANAICEYLDEVYPDPPLLGTDPTERAETRRLIGWFDNKFNVEVTAYLVGEKLLKRFLSNDQPNSAAIRAGRSNIHTHLRYIAWLTERRQWLAGDRLSLADIAAAAHISLVDYTGDVPWEDHPEAKLWYARIKSRPSFRPLLTDQVPGINPSPTYRNLDF